ncbi:MAG: hypothetical protein AB1578_00355 [Thermodesulfobacteriota bacterium]
MERKGAAFAPEEFGAAVFGLPPPVRLSVGLRESPQGAAFEALPDPFARIGGREGLGTIVLGRVTVEGLGNAGNRPVALFLERDACAAAEPLPNPARDQAFERHYRELLRLGQEAGAPVLRPLALGASTGEPPALPSSPPLTFCKRRRLFFTPPCPRCGRPLADCRDDALLAETGLATYSGSARRYVYCPTCAAGAAAGPALFGCGEGTNGGPAGNRWDLVGAWGRLVGEAAGSDPSFPCPGCAHAGGCYPAGSGEGEAFRLLVPFSFHGFRVFALEYLPLTYGEFCDLLGGQSWEALRSGLAERRAFDRLAALPEAPVGDAGNGTAGRRLFLSGEATGRRALEALALKLSAFRELCRGVHAVHRVLGRPHLDLGPDGAWVGLGACGPYAPAYWSFELRLGGVDAARCAGGADGEDAPAGAEPDRFSCRPPPDPDPEYAHPGIARRGPGGPFPGRLTVLSVEPSGGSDARVVRALLAGATRGLEDWGPGDRLRVGFGRAQGFGGDFSLSFFQEARVRDGVRLACEPFAPSTEDLAQWELLRSVPQVEAACSVERGFGPECDLYSLGMLLLRGLSATPAAGPGGEGVLERCREAAARFAQAVGGPSSPGGEAADTRAEVFREVLEDLRFDPEDGVPRELWEDVLSLGSRLVAPPRGASLASLLEELEGLRARVEEALFQGPAPGEGELREILGELIADPSWLDAALGGGGPPPPPLPEPAAAPEVASAPVPEVPPAAPEPPAAEPPDLDATVILRKPGAPAQAPPAPRAAAAPRKPEIPGAGAGEDLESTVILGGRGVRPPQEAPDEEAPGEEAGEDLEKTIILRPAARPKEK